MSNTMTRNELDHEDDERMDDIANGDGSNLRRLMDQTSDPGEDDSELDDEFSDEFEDDDPDYGELDDEFSDEFEDSEDL